MGEGGSVPCSHPSRSGVDSTGSAVDGNGDYQCGDGSWLRPGSAAIRRGAVERGWRTIFFAAGAVGLAWVVWWYVSYRGSNAASIATVDARLLAQELSFVDVVSMRKVQVLVFAKFMSDSAWYFYLFWLPKYLYDVRSFDVKQVSYFAWIPYAASGVGSFLGGWLSRVLLSRGRSLDFSRKLVLGLSAVYAGCDAGAACAGGMGVDIVQHCFFLPAVLVWIDYDATGRHLSAFCGGIDIGVDRVWRGDWRSDLRCRRGISVGTQIWLWHVVCCCRELSSRRLCGDSALGAQNTTA